MTVTYLTGDTRDVTATIPDGSVSLVACSPPFIALRSYLPADHPDKHREIGSEPDPATFIDTLLALTADWGRVLAPWGSIAIELGDTFAGSGGAGGDYNDGGLRQGQNGFTGSARRDKVEQPRQWSGGNGWPQPKCLALVPQAYALSLAYGYNVLRAPMSAVECLTWIDALRSVGYSAERALSTVGGWVSEHGTRPSPAGQWLVRNQIVWHRPNPAVGALGDKFRPSTSYITVATRSAKRWFDLTAVRGEPSPNTHTRTAKGIDAQPTTGKTAAKDGNFHTLNTLHSTAGAPPLDCWFDEHDTWTITTQPSRLAHYAMWPAKLAERLILSMCPAEVCTFCREPRRRVEGATPAYAQHLGSSWADRDLGRSKASGTDRNSHSGQPAGAHITSAQRETTGWTDCGCGVPFTPGTVLDPFAGTGTTLAVADLHGRDAIGIDLDSRNPALYDARRAECARNLFGSPIPDAAQLDLFGAPA